MRTSMRSLLFFTAILALLIGTSFSSASSTKIKASNEKITVSVAVKEAYYGDFDGDGYEDDIYARTEIRLSGASRYNFEYWITLTLPSGRQFVYGWLVNTNMDFLNVSNVMYDSALEPGWYNIQVEILMKSKGLCYEQSNMNFDPPGGTTGTRPSYADFSLL